MIYNANQYILMNPNNYEVIKSSRHQLKEVITRLQQYTLQKRNKIMIKLLALLLVFITNYRKINNLLLQ